MKLVKPDKGAVFRRQRGSKSVPAHLAIQRAFPATGGTHDEQRFHSELTCLAAVDARFCASAL